uniref:Uncharacterized protein n=1 Tax=Colletotrichum godetiae TaxID=1209918 RepID=A0AAJ0EX40_9PEZI|nr:uncharacterized protein BDP55DRAFT_661090 [Colletotrichum godetiae]KAK1676943.1 hypothetical protein BDP55DRAFT_661090 [Colletotrichum godetiae]
MGAMAGAATDEEYMARISAFLAGQTRLRQKKELLRPRASMSAPFAACASHLCLLWTRIDLPPLAI